MTMVHLICLPGWPYLKKKQLSQKLFDYEPFVKYTPWATKPIQREIKTEQSIMTFMKKVFTNQIKNKKKSHEKLKTGNWLNGMWSRDTLAVPFNVWWCHITVILVIWLNDQYVVDQKRSTHLIRIMQTMAEASDTLHNQFPLH